MIDGKQRVYASPDDVPERARARIPDAIFPPTHAECEEFHLERWYVVALLHDQARRFGGVFRN